MPHQDNINANNAFWREMLDHVPVTTLLFRIDQNENAQLFFVNNHVKQDLGFSPEEYVLGSEIEGPIAKELNALIDEIARLSRNEAPKAGFHRYSLTSRHREAVPFLYNFKIFQSRTSRNNLIMVGLTPASVSGQESPEVTSEKSKPDQMPSLFVAESDVMKGVLEKTDRAARSDSHVVFHGEDHVGKRTLANRLLDAIQIKGGDFRLFEADFELGKPEFEFPEFYSGTSGNRFNALTAFREDLIISITGFSKLGKDQAERLRTLLQSRVAAGLNTRLIITSRYPLEQLADEGKIPADLVYRHLFLSIPVPPLRHRKEDIPLLAKKWMAQASRFLNLPEPAFTDAQLFQLEQHPWENNFESFYRLMLMALIDSKGGRPDIRKKEATAPTLPAGMTPGSASDVMTFDDMNRHYLQHVLKITNGKIYGDGGAAELLDLPPTTLQSKLKKLKIR